MNSKLNWREDLKKFHQRHAKILYMIYHLYTIGHLNLEEKKKLKEYVILENQKIFDVFSTFEESLDLDNLLEDVKEIYMEEVRCNLDEGDFAGNLDLEDKISVDENKVKNNLTVNTQGFNMIPLHSCDKELADV